ncbi:hypothetical protein DFJ73DRAFT_867994 [Zopfochytrium polystomum]|nr:hypothetical protein DFJ73DRAFT_867994 [Zopfochytrium polystomum]
MEKYSRWRDPGTGIPPFLPPKRLRTAADETTLRSLNTTVKSIFPGPLLAGIKLLLVVVIGALGWLLSRLEVLFYFPAIRRGWTRGVSLVMGRLALHLLGFYWIKVSTVNLRKGLKEREEAKKFKDSKAITHGDVIVANHSSYVDILYFQTMYSPVFLHVSAAGKVHKVTFLEAILTVGDYPNLSDPLDTHTLAAVVTEARAKQLGPIVVFPEATTTNGRGLIRFTPVLEQIWSFDGKPAGADASAAASAPPRVHVHGIRYDYEEYCPSYTVGGKLSHVIGLAAQWVNRMEVRVLATEEASAALAPVWDDGRKAAEKSPAPAGGGQVVALPQVTAVVAGLLGQVTRLRMTGLGVKDKVEFFDYFVERESKKKK